MFRPQRTGSHWCSSETPGIAWASGTGVSSDHGQTNQSPLHDCHTRNSAFSSFFAYAPDSPDDNIGASGYSRSGNVEQLPSGETINIGVALAAPPDHQSPAYQFTVNMTAHLTHAPNAELSVSAWFGSRVSPDPNGLMPLTNWYFTGTQWRRYGASLGYLIQLPVTAQENQNLAQASNLARMLSVKTDLVMRDSVNDQEYHLPMVFWSITNLDTSTVPFNCYLNSNLHRYQGDISTYEPLR